MARFASLTMLPFVMSMCGKARTRSTTGMLLSQWQPRSISKRGGLWFLDFANAQHKLAIVCLGTRQRIVIRQSQTEEAWPQRHAAYKGRSCALVFPTAVFTPMLCAAKVRRQVAAVHSSRSKLPKKDSFRHAGFCKCPSGHGNVNKSARAASLTRASLRNSQHTSENNRPPHAK